MLITHRIAEMVKTALLAAQENGALPAFDMPDILVEVPRDTSKGDYATATAMKLARVARMAPLKIAQAIADHFPDDALLAAVDVAPPGFINFRLAPSYYQGLVAAILDDAVEFGRIPLGNNRKVQIECVSANPTGPITLGRTRGGVIGDALARIMRAASYDVELEYYYNDAGRQIRLLGEATKIRFLQLIGRDDALTDDHYQGDYLIDIARDLLDEHGPALADKPAAYFGDHAKSIISAQQKESLARIGIVHDSYFNEARITETGELEEVMTQLQNDGWIYAKEGAWWLKTTEFGDDEDRVAVRSGDGQPTYRMNDIVYHRDKARRNFDLVVDIFGPDHAAEAPQVLWGVQMLGINTDFVYTLLHQIVALIRDGEKVKMSTRRGQYVTLDELVDEVGRDPIRYFFISRSANSHVNFDMDLAVEQSDKNPVYYIQNAHVRCAGIFRKWVEEGNAADADLTADIDLSLLSHEKELAFLRQVAELPQVIEKVATTYEPHHMTFYAFDLAAAFHPLYEASRVMSSSDEISAELQLARLHLYRAAKKLLGYVLDLIGMTAPEVM